MGTGPIPVEIPGLTFQPLISVKDGPGGRNRICRQRHAVIYNEFEDGQVVFFNYDLSAWVNHTTQTCDGGAPDPAPDYQAGTYAGRVEIVHFVLQDLFGLDPD
jgi:hypothetical protein